jgi:hypothetical protein
MKYFGRKIRRAHYCEAAENHYCLLAHVMNFLHIKMTRNRCIKNTLAKAAKRPKPQEEVDCFRNILSCPEEKLLELSGFPPCDSITHCDTCISNRLKVYMNELPSEDWVHCCGLSDFKCIGDDPAVQDLLDWLAPQDMDAPVKRFSAYQSLYRFYESRPKQTDSDHGPSKLKRVRISSCVVCKIKLTFPSPTYTGYRNQSY